MRNMGIIIGIAVVITASAGCEKMKEPSGVREEASEEFAVAPPPDAPSEEPFHVPNKEEYYRMLRSGYEPPRHNVSGEGYYSSGTTSPRRRLSEKEGEGLKWKFGEGRKYAASGRGEEPKVPSYIEHDEGGTYPPGEFKGHD